MRQTPDENSPDARHDKLRGLGRRRPRNAFEPRLAGDETRHATFDIALQSAASMIPLREQTKPIAVTTINEVRMAIRELGRAWRLPPAASRRPRT